MSRRRSDQVHIIVIVCALALSRTTSAQPLIHVRGRSDLRLQLVSSGRAPLIQGALISDAGEPLGSRNIRAALGTTDPAQELTLVTDADGGFALELDPALDRANVVVRFLGDTDYTACDATLRVDRDALAAAGSSDPPESVLHEDSSTHATAPPARLGTSSQDALQRAALLAFLLAIGWVLLELPAASRARRARTRAMIPDRSGLIATRTKTDRAAHYKTIVARAVDHETGAPLPRAVVTLESSTGTRVLATLDPRGEFGSPPLEVGGWLVRVEHPAYQSVRDRITIPHRGEWIGAEIRLCSLRSEAMRVARRALVHAVPEAGDRPDWTLRTALNHVRPDSVSRERLAALIASVEATSYGTEPPTPPQIARIEQQSEELMGLPGNPPSLRVEPRPLPESGPQLPGRR